MIARFIILLFAPLSLIAQIFPPPPTLVQPMAGCDLPALTDLPVATRLEYLDGKTFDDLRKVSCNGSLGFVDSRYLVIPNNIYQIYSLHPEAILVSHVKRENDGSNYEFRNIYNERIGEGYVRLLGFSVYEARENLILQTAVGRERRYVVCSPDGTQRVSFGNEASANKTGDYISILRDSVYDIYSAHKLDFVATGAVYPVATSYNLGRNGANHRFYVSRGNHTYELDRWGKRLRDLPFAMVEPIEYNSTSARSLSRNEFLGYRVPDGNNGFTVLAKNLRDTLVAPFPYRVQGKTGSTAFYTFFKNGKYGLVDAEAKVMVEAFYWGIKYLPAEKLIRLSIDRSTHRYINLSGEDTEAPE